MTQGSVHPLVRYLRTLAAASASGDSTDEELLDRFLSRRDEDAFAALVCRYGSLVFGVCRRVLGHVEDAEDAFQATFVVFALKAGSIRRRESLASFLHGVAERVARKALRTRTRRRDRPRPVPETAVPDAVAAVIWSDLRAALDEEIRRLPALYRAAFILCHLEGHSNAEAARRLGCPKGTILSRLARARERLARRLSRRGITLPAAAMTTMLSVEMLRAGVPPKLAAAAVRLTGLLAGEGMLPAGLVSAPVFALVTDGGKMMLWTKMIAVLAMMAASAALTASVVAPRSSPASAETSTPQVAVVSEPEAKPNPQPEPPKKGKEEASLETIRRKWAEADAKIGEMHVRFTRMNTDPTFDEKMATKGQASFKKPNLWRIDRLDKQGGKLDILLLESKRLHVFVAETKTERIFAFPERPKGNLGNGMRVEPPWFLRAVWDMDEQIHWLSFGPQARDMDSRYKLGLAKQDQWYIYLDIKPRNKKWFECGRIVLDRKTYQVRQVWFEYSNRAEVVVDFLDRQTIHGNRSRGNP